MANAQPFVYQQAVAYDAIPESLVLLDRGHRFVMVDPVFCQTMHVALADLAGHTVEVVVGALAYREVVKPALERCFAGQAVVHQLWMAHSALGPRQFSIRYQLCSDLAGEAPLAAMHFRDITTQKTADTALYQYVQQQEALHAIDRASLADQKLEVIAALAIDSLMRLSPCRRVSITIAGEGLGTVTTAKQRSESSLATVILAREGDGYVQAPLGAGFAPNGDPVVVGEYRLALPLQVQGEVMGEMIVEPLAPALFDSSQTAIAREIADRMERALHHVLIGEKLRRYTVELEHAVAERTQEIERRRQAAQGLREILGFLNANRPLGEIFNQIFKQAELLLGADAIAVFSPVDATAPEIGPANQIFAHSTTSTGIGERDFTAARAAAMDAVRDRKSVVIIVPSDQPISYRAQLAVPMQADRGVFGVVVYFFADETNLALESLDLAVALGEQVVLATDSDRLQQRAQDAAVLEERERLVRELHDAVTQSIYSLTLFAEAGRRVASLGQLDRVQEYLATLADVAQQALKQMRLMLYELRPVVLEQVGLIDALRHRLEAVEQRAGIQTRLEAPDSFWLPPLVEQSVYRICQEALNNALKHASASEVVVQLAVDRDVVTLDIRDNGIGFVLDDVAVMRGPGLAHIRERAARLNANLTIETEPDHGTHMQISLVVPELVVAQARPGGMVEV